MIADGLTILDRIVLSVKLVRERLRRTTQALWHPGIPYAVVGGNAVILWVETVDESATRNTPNVDILVRRDDLDRVAIALESAGFVGDPERSDLFRDGPEGSRRTRLRLIYAGERVRETELLSSPAVTDSMQIGGFSVLSLPALVQTKLNAFRTVDRVHLHDMLEVGLIDETWKARYPPELAERLQMLIDTPEG